MTGLGEDKHADWQLFVSTNNMPTRATDWELRSTVILAMTNSYLSSGERGPF